MKRVKIVIVGLNFGNYILNSIVDGPGGEFLGLVGVCDLDAVEMAEKSFNLGVRAYDSLDAVLADPTLEAVGLFTGPAGRAELVRRCIRAGKHVLTTKPFERDADAAFRSARSRSAGNGRLSQLTVAPFAARLGSGGPVTTRQPDLPQQRRI